ncbi:hypothetical protein K449DRAFT_387195 [Hypoxylon sp. EC38]|nr:hypothetical protein K449DRAFT_387195 [Hypoxylon sp. EC38]
MTGQGVDIAKRRPYDCDCKYVDLRPTCFNPCPPHRHRTDEECSLGSRHTKHCIYADHSPTECVISGSREQHEHCVPPPQDYEAILKMGFGNDCLATAEDLYKEAERGIDNTFASMDLELSYIDLPSMRPQATPSPRLGFTRYNKHKVTKRLCVRSPAARRTHRVIQDVHINREAFGSPEPKDMVF